MMKKVSYYTKAGFQKLAAELNMLKTKERAKVAAQLAEAREKGDLSENAEYDAAKDAQALLEMRISDLEQVVAHARVISSADIDTSQVAILTKVKIRHIHQATTFTYTIVAEEEADIKEGKISVDSPIGSGLLGKKIGDIAHIDTPSGSLSLEILNIGC